MLGRWAAAAVRPPANGSPEGHHPLVPVRRHHALRHLELDLVAQQPQLLRLRRAAAATARAAAAHAVGAAEGASAASQV